jgi:hypothetical protein
VRSGSQVVQPYLADLDSPLFGTERREIAVAQDRREVIVDRERVILFPQLTEYRKLGLQTYPVVKDWARDTTTTVGGSDVANDQLYAASLAASHAGDQGAWRHLSTLSGCDAMLRLDRHADPEKARAGVETLRLAGAVSELALAVTRLVSDGPAVAVTAAVAAVDLDRSTRTTGRADLELLRRGGDVAERETANRTIRWLLAALDDPSSFAERTTPSYLLDVELADTLAQLAPAGDCSAIALVAEHVVNLAPQSDQLPAQSWAKVVRHLPARAWGPDAAHRAGTRASEHHDALRVPLLGVAAHHDQASRARLLADAAAGSADALHTLGPVRKLPRDLVEGSTRRAAFAARGIVRNAHRGRFGYGGHDAAATLAALNMAHPIAAQWDPLLDLLADDAVAVTDKRGAMRMMVSHAERIDAATRRRLAPIATRIAKRQAPVAIDPIEGQRDL